MEKQWSEKNAKKTKEGDNCGGNENGDDNDDVGDDDDDGSDDGYTWWIHMITIEKKGNEKWKDKRVEKNKI